VLDLTITACRQFITHLDEKTSPDLYAACVAEGAEINQWDRCCPTDGRWPFTAFRESWPAPVDDPLDQFANKLGGSPEIAACTAASSGAEAVPL
jgi:hypothetical protein